MSIFKQKQIINIGVGNTGCILSSIWQKTFPNSKQILISSAQEDTNTILENFNVDRKNATILELKKEGNEKKFSFGKKMWEEKDSEIFNELSLYKNKIIFVWTAMGGGTSSSSYKSLANALDRNDNKIYFVNVLPSVEERIPANANMIMSANMAQEISLSKNVNIILYDRNVIDKRFKNNINITDSYIIETVKMMFELLDEYSVRGYSPITIDSSELESIYSSQYQGFTEITFEDIRLNKKEQFMIHTSKFKNEKQVKNIMIALMVNNEFSNEQVDEINIKFNDLLKRYGRRYKNSRIIPGIIRTKGKGVRLFVVAQGIYPSDYLEKNKQKALELIKMNKSDLETTFHLEENDVNELTI